MHWVGASPWLCVLDSYRHLSQEKGMAGTRLEGTCKPGLFLPRIRTELLVRTGPAPIKASLFPSLHIFTYAAMYTDF